MQASEQTKIDSCHGECSKCSMGLRADLPGGLKGWPLVVSAGVSFLLPLVTAIIGAGIGRGETNRQAAGAMIGLAIGLLLAIVIQKVLKSKLTPPSETRASDDEENS